MNRYNYTNVSLIHGDIRTWDKPHYQAHILVSELLGGFGDNELSPELLELGQKYLKTSGFSIPASYTSCLAPVQCPLIHQAIENKEKMYTVKLFKHF